MDPRVLDPAHAATPFTAAEIRGGSRVGKTIDVRVEIEGEAPFVRRTRYVACDEDGAVIERLRLAEDGTSAGPPERSEVTWRELQGHASFPAEHTTIERTLLDTALGRLDCLRYTVRDGETERVFWFATDLPGMPVRTELRQDGRVRSTTAMLRNGDATSAPRARP